MRHPPRRRRCRERRHRPRQCAAVAAEIGHAAFPRADHGQAGGHGAQDLSVDRQAAAGRTTIVVSRDRDFCRAGHRRGAEPRRGAGGGARRCAAAQLPTPSWSPAAPKFIRRRCRWRRSLPSPMCISRSTAMPFSRDRSDTLAGKRAQRACSRPPRTRRLCFRHLRAIHRSPVRRSQPEHD